MSWLSILISVASAVVLGVILGYVISRILIKGRQKRIVENAYEKILKQKQIFIFNGKKYSLKAEIKKGMEGAEPEIEREEGDEKGVKNIKKIISKTIKSEKEKKKK